MPFPEEDEDLYEEDDELGDDDGTCEICGLYFCDCGGFDWEDEYLD